jgi:hypothetical protein
VSFDHRIKAVLRGCSKPQTLKLGAISPGYL